ncbi:respiratory nitrate reductase subunit gamma [Streptomyces sp. NPDC001250]|uniref:respiratory nitrate reductase subunit gamma n=1 Tax=unclassified Streptomyces TaxID=2593676 RepID=UPI0033219B65
MVPQPVFVLDPDVGATAHAPLVHRLHALLALALFALFALFALWPFNRLVHASPSHWVTSSARTSSTDREAGRAPVTRSWTGDGKLWTDETHRLWPW